MKKTSILLLLLTSFLFFSCKREIKPTFEKVENVIFKKEDGKITVYGDVIMNNPNKVGVTIEGSDLTLSINQKEIGKATFEKPFTVEANKDFAIPLVLSFEPDRILSNLFSVGGLGSMLKTKKADFIVDGTVSIKIVKKEFKIPVYSKEEVDLRPKY